MNGHAVSAALLVLGADLIIALGAASCWAAYTSGDPSGIQYIFLPLGAMIAGFGLVPLLLSRLEPRVPRLALAPLASAAGVGILAALPWVTRLGNRLDGPGAALGLVLLVLHVPVTVISVRAALRAGPDAPDEVSAGA